MRKNESSACIVRFINIDVYPIYIYCDIVLYTESGSARTLLFMSFKNQDDLGIGLDFLRNIKMYMYFTLDGQINTIPIILITSSINQTFLCLLNCKYQNCVSVYTQMCCYK